LRSDQDEIPILDGSAPAPSSLRRFAADQMVRCVACDRPNPPTRAKCLYCGFALPSTEFNAVAVDSNEGQKERLENGFTTILLPVDSQTLQEDAILKLSSLLRLEVRELNRIIEARSPLPVVRSSTLGEASEMSKRLETYGLRLLTLSDQELDSAAFHPRRISSLRITDDGLTGNPAGGGEELSIEWDSILLIVIGRLFVRRNEIEERRARGSRSEILDSREMSADEAVVDVYSFDREQAWRLAAGGFDFSCLGKAKKLTAVENFSSLISLLRERARRASYDDRYPRLRSTLEPFWPLEQRTSSEGWRRTSQGKYGTQSVITSDNEKQFRLYSRLRYYFKVRERDLAL
jgi:hypothetical protein